MKAYTDALPILALVALLLNPPTSFGQTFLIADGETDTYSLIRSVLGADAIEAPDCSHPDFGPHITQEWDSDLGKDSFVMYIHVTPLQPQPLCPDIQVPIPPDNNKCQCNDKQRNEIKTYNHSSPYLQCFRGDTATYRWKFKLDAGFQASRGFTHIHQIKSDVEGSQPLMTLTPRAGNPDRFQLEHYELQPDGTEVRRVLATTDLAAFKGAWVEAYERITCELDGPYSIQISASDGTVLLSYSSDNIDMWRNEATLVRPKWGVYRGIGQADLPHLRDEALRFDSFCLAKGSDDCP